MYLEWSLRDCRCGMEIYRANEPFGKVMFPMEPSGGCDREIHHDRGEFLSNVDVS